VYRSLSILDPVAGSIAALVSYDEAGAAGCSAGVCHAIAASGPSGNLVAPSNHVISTRKVIGTDPQHPIAHAFVSTMNAAGTVTWGATLATASPSVPDADVGKVAVSSSTVYVPVGNGIQAFALDQPSCPGAGCTPLWRSTTASSLLTVANGVLYDDRGRAFDAAGSTGCSGAPKVCAPVAFIGSSDSGGETEVANGWIYRSLPDGLEAYHLP
jgi:hypothetical protein